MKTITKPFRSSVDRFSPTPFIFTDKRSLTVPEAGISVREIMTKFAQGISVPTSEGTYSGDLPDTRYMDLHEHLDYQNDNKAYIKQLEEERDKNVVEYNAAVRDAKAKKLTDKKEE